MSGSGVMNAEGVIVRACSADRGFCCRLDEGTSSWPAIFILRSRCQKAMGGGGWLGEEGGRGGEGPRDTRSAKSASWEALKRVVEEEGTEAGGGE